LKRATVVVLVSVVVLAGLFFYAASRSVPPAERKFIQNFHAHRATYERLRDMLQADRNLIRLGSWGVETTDNVVPSLPPEGNFPVDRYQEYMALLKEVGGVSAARGEGEEGDPNILLWGWGFAGDTRHVGICWRHLQPTDRIATLDGYRGRSRYPIRKVVYRHIDANWYLWTDL
jgi:hypothetical protein